MTASAYRYPGVRPFERSERNTFFGRDQDLDHLFLLVSREPVTVLFGKSGTGKSSLVNAGLLPRLADASWHTCTFRFGAHRSGDTSATLSDLLLARAHETVGNNDAPNWLDDFAARHDIPITLWHVLKKQEFQQGASRCDELLVFDQFEEVFSWPASQLENFKTELATVTRQSAPLPYLNALKASNFDLPANKMEQLLAPLEAHLLFVMRSDQLSWLDRLADRLPGILRTRFETTSFTREQARHALVSPAQLTGNFVSPSFVFTPAALDQLLGNLANEEGKIEPFQLQVYGQALEKRVIDHPGDTEIQPEDLPDYQNIYENYYQDALGQLPPEEAELAQRAIEEALLFEDQNGEVRRLSVYEGMLQQQYHLSAATLRQLTDIHLLRAEPGVGGYYYEIAHDTLLMTILQSKRRRLGEGEQKTILEIQRNIVQQNELLREMLEIRRRSMVRASKIALLSILFNLLLFILLLRYC